MAYEQKIGLSRRLTQSLVITRSSSTRSRSCSSPARISRTLVQEEVEQNPTLEELSRRAGGSRGRGRRRHARRAHARARRRDERRGAQPIKDETPSELAPEASNLGDINWDEYLSDYANNFTQGSLSGGSGGDYDEEKRPSLENTLTRDFVAGRPPDLAAPHGRLRRRGADARRRPDRQHGRERLPRDLDRGRGLRGRRRPRVRRARRCARSRSSIRRACSRAICASAC